MCEVCNAVLLSQESLAVHVLAEHIKSEPVDTLQSSNHNKLVSIIQQPIANNVTVSQSYDSKDDVLMDDQIYETDELLHTEETDVYETTETKSVVELQADLVIE